MYYSRFLMEFHWWLGGKKKTQVQSLGQEDSLEKELATRSNILPWKIPRTEKPRE